MSHVMGVKSVLSRVDISCRSLASKGGTLQIQPGTRGKKRDSGGLARTPNECSRLYGKFMSLYIPRYLRPVFGLTSSSAEVSCHHIGTAK